MLQANDFDNESNDKNIINNNINDSLLRPFEWLTSSESIKPFIVYGLSLLTPVQSSSSSITNDNNTTTTTTNVNNVSVLHVGCGSSILGELLIEDDDSTNNTISYVVNIDSDMNVLHRMEQRWIKRCHSRRKIHHQQQEQQKHNQQQDEYDEIEKRLQFRQVIFADEWTTLFGDNDNNNKPEQLIFDMIIDKGTLDCLLCYPNDSVISYLYLLFYNQQQSQQQLQQQLPLQNNPTTTTTTTKTNDDSSNSVYIWITYQPTNFIIQLIQNLPYIQWDIFTIQTINRHTESLLTDNKDSNNTKTKSTSTSSSQQQQQEDTLLQNNNNNININININNNNNDNDHTTNELYSKMNNINNYDKNKTIQVVTCRRKKYCCLTASTHTVVDERSSNSSNDNSNNNNNTTTNTTTTFNYNLWNELKNHVQQTMNQQYQIDNPLLTHERIQQIYTLFQSHHSITTSSKNNNNQSSVSDAIYKNDDLVEDKDKEDSVVLSLIDAYNIIFTSIEKDNYNYNEDFVPDFIEFCQNHCTSSTTNSTNNSNDDDTTIDNTTASSTTDIYKYCLKNNVINAKIAIEFLKEYQ